MKPIAKNKHAVIRICKHVLKTEDDITEDHVERVKRIFEKHLDSGMSPRDIKSYYFIDYSDFGMFLKKCLKIELRNLKDAINNYNKKVGRSVTDEKLLYHKQCRFAFDPYSIPAIPGYEKLLEVGMYHPITNPDGVCRDHIVSVAYGWRNNISPDIISHPCNCQYLTNAENIAKSDRSHLTIDELLDRIDKYDLSPVTNKAIHLPKTREHRNKISETNSLYMNVTNGKENLRILKTDIIPDGYKRGLTRKIKMVGAEGLEPPIR